MTLPYASYVDAVAEEADRLVQAVEDHLATPVRSCPGWSAADLLTHLSDVYDRFTAQLLAAEASRRAAPAEPTGTGIERFEASSVALLAALEASSPDAPAWNWSGEDLNAMWIARRMALETAVHRVDAEETGGEARPIEAELAADGIDERIEVHLRMDLRQTPDASLGGSLCLIASDVPVAFHVEVSRGRLRWRQGRGPADAALVGTASQLFLFSWNRLGVDDLALTGRREVAEAWKGLPV
ncbi:MAG: hypothetical protein JWM85_89 [Acidimicrobiaceae bacterium]|nr:hypothetical protein [Acidimicrobiaceae bacterium]